MLNSLSSNAILAKARAIYGKRLKNSDYNELLRQHTVADVAAYLKSSTDYAKALSGINEVSIHRGQLENLINRSLYDKFYSLAIYDFSPNEGFYRYVITNAEVGLILRTIMLLNSDSQQDILFNLPSFIQSYICFDLLSLPKTKSFSDLLRAMQNTPYAAVLKRFEAPNGEIDLAGCEVALKTYYYQSIFDSIEKYFKGKAKQELKEAVLIEIELMNLTLIYRLRRYFDKSSAEIRSRLLPFRYKLTDRALTQLLEAKEKDGFVRDMRLSIYSGKMRGVSFNYIEDYTKRLRYLISRQLLRFSTNATVVFFSFMTLTRIEIENITTVIEGIRYQNPSSEIQKLLILE